MGKMFNKILNVMNIGNDYDEEEDYYDEEENEDYDAPKASKKKAAVQDDIAEKPAKRVKQSKVVPIRSSQKDAMEVCVMKPNKVADASEIAETLLNGRSVVLNLEGINVDIAQRIIDFTSGACFSINGNLQKISSFIFICTPENVDVSGDFQELINGSYDLSTIVTHM